MARRWTYAPQLAAVIALAVAAALWCPVGALGWSLSQPQPGVIQVSSEASDTSTGWSFYYREEAPTPLMFSSGTWATSSNWDTPTVSSVYIQAGRACQYDASAHPWWLVRNNSTGQSLGVIAASVVSQRVQLSSGSATLPVSLGGTVAVAGAVSATVTNAAASVTATIASGTTLPVVVSGVGTVDSSALDATYVVALFIAALWLVFRFQRESDK